MKPDEEKPEPAGRPPILDRFVRAPVPGVAAVVRDDLQILEPESTGYDPYDNPGPPRKDDPRRQDR